MRLHSYVLDHDYGFAPNPFYSVCSLATCKAGIRQHAEIGDFVVGTGSAKRGRRGFLVYFMVVDEITDYNRYWNDARFRNKRPYMRGSKMQSFGDNIYHRDPRTLEWSQLDSLHSLADGRPNPLNIEHDTKSERVLLSKDFAYWGGDGPEIPATFRNFSGANICAQRGHKNNFDEQHRDEFIAWLRSLNESGYVGTPLDWSRSG